MTVVTDVNVTLPNGISVLVTHIGTIKLTPTLELTNVLCVPSFDFNLISISKLTSSLHCCVFFLSNLCFIQDLLLWRMIGLGKQRDGLYILQQSVDLTKVASVSPSHAAFAHSLYSLSSITHSTNTFHTWHCRLGHPSHSRLSFLSNVLPDVSFPSNNSATFICNVCPLAKQKRLSFPNHNHVSPSCFDLIHVDIWGPYQVPTVEGYRYFLTLVDDHSRTTWLYLMKSKSKAIPLLESFIIMIHTQFNCHVKIVRSDNGQEFNLSSFYASKGIEH